MSNWLLGTLIATSALITLVLLVREPVRRQFGSRVTYGLWLIPAARLLMPTLTTTVGRTVPRAAAVQPLAQPVVGEPSLLSHVGVADPSLFVRLGGWPILLLAVWLAVALGLFVSRMAAFHRDRRAILNAGAQVDRIGSVRIVRSPEVPSPVAFGILDRVIAVPADFDRNYCARERRLALEHELAHHRSGDLFANLFAFVLLCLQWFNPLAWVAHAAFRFDQEAACDARVLDKASAHVRADYGRTIAKAASARALLFASALDRRSTLQRRLECTLRSANRARRLSGRMLVGIAIAVALPLTASRAIEYVDVPAGAVLKAPSAQGARKVPATTAVQSVAPVNPPPLAAPTTIVDAVAEQTTRALDGRQIDVVIDNRQIDAAAEQATRALDDRKVNVVIDDRQIDAIADAAAEQATRALDDQQVNVVIDDRRSTPSSTGSKHPN